MPTAALRGTRGLPATPDAGPEVDIDVVIPARNEAAQLPRLLDGPARQTLAPASRPTTSPSSRPVSAMNGVDAVGANLPCLIVQRFNRARLLRIRGRASIRPWS